MPNLNLIKISLEINKNAFRLCREKRNVFDLKKQNFSKLKKGTFSKG